MTASLPDFVIIGAMKCGTSTLAVQLALQEGVFVTTPKEPNYFSDDDVYARGPDWYGRLFAEAAPGDLKGEASTHYTKLPTYPQTLARMTAVLEAPKLIYVIRNPVARAVSHFIHEWSQGQVGNDIERAFRESGDFVDYGCYARQIAPFIEAYGPARIHLTSLEQIKADPDTEFAAIARFLGLPESAAWRHDLPPQNVSAERVRVFPMRGLLLDNPVATALRRTLVPKSVRTWVRQRRSMTTRPELTEALCTDLQRRFLEDRAQLAGLFPGHPALDLCYPFADGPAAP